MCIYIYPRGRIPTSRPDERRRDNSGRDTPSTTGGARNERIVGGQIKSDRSYEFRSFVNFFPTTLRDGHSLTFAQVPVTAAAGKSEVMVRRDKRADSLLTHVSLSVSVQ